MKILSTDEYLCTFLIKLILICLSEVSNGKMTSFEFVDDISSVPKYEVFEGDTIDLICRREPTDSEIVEIEGKNDYYVKNGELIQSLQSNNITFMKNESVVILTLHNIGRHSGDDFTCKRPSKYVKIKVLYSPLGSPLITSDYISQYFCGDELRGPFQFNCTTEVGYPPVNISLYFEKGERNLTVNSTDYIITPSASFKHLSFVTYLDSSFNDARLVCSITQQLPEDYGNYKNSAFIDISPQGFSLNIYHSNYTVAKGEVITLVCSSNVSGFLLEWIDIPLEDTQYNISSVNNSIKMMIFNDGSIVNGSIIIQCRGSCRGEVMSTEVTISVNNENLAGKGEKDVNVTFMILWICIMVIMTISVGLPLAIILVLTCKRKCFNITIAEGVNKNNEKRARSNLPTERQRLRYPDTESRGNPTCEEIINKPIDEKEKIGVNNVIQNNSSIEMVVNPEYEPFKSKIESEINGTDDGYASVC